MNSLRHGLRARTVVLPGENRDEFHRLCDDLEVEWQPQSASEQFYLEQMAVSQWKLARMEVAEANLCKETVISIKTQVPLLDRLWQAQSRMERSYARAQRELERLQNSRRNQVPDPPEEEAPAPQPAADVPPAAASPAASEPQPTPKVPSFTSATEVAAPGAPASSHLEPDCEAAS